MSADLNGLLERCREANGASRELDADVLKALGFSSWAGRMFYRMEDGRIGSSAVTASIDAALALVERVLPGWKISIHGILNAAQVLIADGTTPYAEAKRGDSGSYPRPMALAILVALLSALISKADR